MNSSAPGHTNDDEHGLSAVAQSHLRLLTHLADLNDDQARQPSLLPGWSVGHVLTHIARNADAMRGMAEAANRGEQGVMYAGGADQRNGDIETGSVRSATELVDDIRRASAVLEQAFSALTTQGWEGAGTFMNGSRPVRDFPLMRQREVEVHHADLGLAYTWRDWPEQYVRTDLNNMVMLWASRQPMGLTTLPEAALQAEERQRLAWLMGRATIDGLDAAGIY